MNSKAYTVVFANPPFFRDTLYTVVFIMSNTTTHKKSFLQLAKNFFSGRNKNMEIKISDERTYNQKVLRKTVSLDSSCIMVTREPDVWCDYEHDKNCRKHKELENRKEHNESQIFFKTKYYSERTKDGRDLDKETSFKPKYHSQKLKDGRSQNELLSTQIVKLKHPSDKPGKRTLSLKGSWHGGGKMWSCPDLASKQEYLERGSHDILKTFDSLDRTTVKMFGDQQSLETELIEIYFD